jgi:hypothetical protein
MFTHNQPNLILKTIKIKNQKIDHAESKSAIKNSLSLFVQKLAFLLTLTLGKISEKSLRMRFQRC